MKNFLYKKSPVFIQNILVTIKNIFVLNKKYGYIPFFNSLKKIQTNVEHLKITYNEEELIYNINYLKDIAIKNTNYYKKYKNKFNTIKKLNEIKNWPILKKRILKENNNDFFSKNCNLFNSFLLHTSGTTGTPLKIKVLKKDLRKRYLVLLKTMTDFGFDINKPLARFTGYNIFDNNVIYRKDILNNHFFLSSFHISKENINKYYEVITKNNIAYLEGYPSAIYLLAKLLKERNLKVNCIEKIFTTAEKLYNYQKEFLEDFFNCKVFDYYGSNDQSVLIYTCPYGKLHLANVTGYLEVLDEFGNDVKKGEAGSMIITSFTSKCMPLIRYEIGDSCIVSKNQKCECNSNTLIIDEILGRDEDIFKANNGNYITRFSVFLKKLPDSIIESQLVINENKKLFLLKYVSNKNLEKVDFMNFEQELKKIIGNDYIFQYKKVDEIPLTKKGKKKAVKIEK